MFLARTVKMLTTSRDISFCLDYFNDLCICGFVLWIKVAWTVVLVHPKIPAWRPYWQKANKEHTAIRRADAE